MNHDRMRNEKKNKTKTNSKVLTKSFQTPPASKPKRQRAASYGDEEDEHAISLPTQRVTPSEKIATDVKSTISEPIKPARKKTVGSVSYLLSIHFVSKFYHFH